MTFLTGRPIWVDGVRLDSLAWGITGLQRAVASRRANDLIVPGMDGVVASLNDDLETVPLGLEMLVMGTDYDGAVPAQGGPDTFRDNLDELLHLFGKRTALLDVWMAQDDAPIVNVVMDPATAGTTGTYLVNPTATRNNVGASNSYTSAVVTGAGDAPAGTSLTSYFRMTFSAANGTFGHGWWAWITPGIWELSVYVRPSRAGMAAQSVTMGQAAGGNSSPATGATVLSDTQAAMTAGAWTRAVKRYRVATPGLAYIGMTFGSGAPLVAGDTIDLAGIQAVQLSSVADAVVPFSYGGQAGMAWTGPVNRSPSVSSSVRRAYAKVTDTIAPEVNLPGSSGTLNVALDLVEGNWRDMATVDSGALTGFQTNQYAEVVALQGSTDRITDTVFVVTGPATNPKVWDANTGAYVQLTLALAAGDTWRVNVGTWSSRTALSGSPLTLDSLDTDGTDRQSVTTFGGTKNQSRFLPFTPTREGSLRKVRVRLSASSGVTSATSLNLRTLRRFAA